MSLSRRFINLFRSNLNALFDGVGGEDPRLEEMFPLDRLDDAAGAVCMGLVLRDGTTVYGGTRPRACR